MSIIILVYYRARFRRNYSSKNKHKTATIYCGSAKWFLWKIEVAWRACRFWVDQTHNWYLQSSQPWRLDRGQTHFVSQNTIHAEKSLYLYITFSTLSIKKSVEITFKLYNRIWLYCQVSIFALGMSFLVPTTLTTHLRQSLNNINLQQQLIKSWAK